MDHFLVGAALAFLLGTAAAAVNTLITKTVSERMPERIMLASFARTAIIIVTFVIVYFAAPLTPWARIPMLIGAAVGLSIPSLLFTFLLARRMDKQAHSEKKGED